MGLFGKSKKEREKEYMNSKTSPFFQLYFLIFCLIMC